MSNHAKSMHSMMSQCVDSISSNTPGMDPSYTSGNAGVRAQEERLAKPMEMPPDMG